MKAFLTLTQLGAMLGNNVRAPMFDVMATIGREGGQLHAQLLDNPALIGMAEEWDEAPKVYGTVWSRTVCRAVLQRERAATVARRHAV